MVWHRCQLAPESFCARLLLIPWSSETTKSTPFNPRSFNQQKNLFQLSSDSLSPIMKPKTSRMPSWFTPIAISMLRCTTRWSSLILIIRASTIKKGYWLSFKERFFQHLSSGQVVCKVQRPWTLISLSRIILQLFQLLYGLIHHLRPFPLRPG